MLNNNNTYLQSAKNTKNDEFYTPFEVIEKEMIQVAKWDIVRNMPDVILMIPKFV